MTNVIFLNLALCDLRSWKTKWMILKWVHLGDTPGTWLSTDPNVVEKGFLDTANPVEAATPQAVANTVNGKAGPLNGCNG